MFVWSGETIMDKDLKQRGLENQAEGKMEEMKGDARAKIGDATDDQSEHIKGHAEELKGKIKKNFGKAEEKIDDAV